MFGDAAEHLLRRLPKMVTILEIKAKISFFNIKKT